MQFGSYGYVDTSTSFKVTAPYGTFFLTGEEKEFERLQKEFAPWPVEVVQN